MQWIDLFGSSHSLFLAGIALLGLIVGSFLNVVIWRLPQMLRREWASQCYEYLQENIPALETTIQPHFSKNTKPFNLITPPSHCPQCNHKISVVENIPLISFIFLKGRCRHCKTPISWRYPLIEIFTALLSVIVAFVFGLNLQTFAGLILTWSLFTLSVIDWEHQILPDDITFPLLWLGLIFNIQHVFTDITSAVIGAIAGYLFLWSVYWLFKLFTGKEGMGYGDFKLLAMLGAWLGWSALLKIVLISSFLGAGLGITLILLKRHSKEQPIPFGPFLALGGWVTMLWGDKISRFYTMHFTIL
ncbi:MAG: prepilin peptidase [Gammaproteobacteria bacterium 39-13]|nr:prepilin peptidase [Gammaproteobacteria bacterium]OJV94001.1 MAG: prepilin peptidase [Gammaproteobacteria bacterium 39-13]